MKKVVLFLFLASMAFAAHAQVGSWYVSVLPGFQLESGAAGFPDYVGQTGSMKPLAGLTASVDGEYFYTDNLALHMGLIYNQGKFRQRVLIYHMSPTPWWSVRDFENTYGIFEVGPELVAPLGRDGQLYFQLNVGVTFAHESYQAYGGPSDATFRNGTTYGGAIGYRHFFGERAGIAAQLAYHRVDKWKTDHVDVRVGVVFRF